MTPTQRAALHQAIDHAINLGAPVHVMVHPRHPEDVAPLFEILTSFSEARFNADEWTDFEVVTTNPTTDHGVTLFTKSALRSKPRPGPATNADRAQVTSTAQADAEDTNRR
jgi:hypothetical protein